MTGRDKDRIDRAANYLPWRDPNFRLANAWAYLKWLKAEKAKRDALIAARKETGK